ncbi:hypothetical protein EDC04DRAFT_853627 [Pisolithus marmoratus]|nr:hypothetical protein EDC04DRAFT_853627 [Pisolithus marmoratus]
MTWQLCKLRTSSRKEKWAGSNYIILKELAGKLAHGLENIMLMEYYCHLSFVKLVLWLKPVEACLPDLFLVRFPSINGVYHTWIVFARQGLKEELNIPDASPLKTVPTISTVLIGGMYDCMFLRIIPSTSACIQRPSGNNIIAIYVMDHCYRREHTHDLECCLFHHFGVWRTRRD